MASADISVTVNPSAISGVRFLVSKRIEELEASASKQEGRLVEANQRRTDLRAEIDAAEAACSHVRRNMQRLNPDEIAGAFSHAATARSQLATLGETMGDVAARLADLRGEQEVLRSIHRSLDDLSAGAGTLPAAAVPRGRASRQIFQMIEGERMRIARDMHDGPAQSLANLVLQAEILERLMKKDPSLVEQELLDFKDGVRGVLDDTRRLIFDLRPMTLDDLGLVPTLRKFLADFGERQHITTHLRVLGEEVRLSGTYEPTIFRIVQEALNNIWKHAHADDVEVVISFAAKAVIATVKDNGCGFDVAATEARADIVRSLGLTSMRERTDLEHGTLQIRSQMGVGTEVKVTFALG